MVKQTADRLAEWLPVPCLGSYGLTEATCISYSTPTIYNSGRTDSSGYPIDLMSVRIADVEGKDVSFGEYGEVFLCGSVVMDGYWNQPELTSETIVDGWLRTGDLGRLDDDGALTVIDRVKDMIITGGENVYPGEVESIISTLPGVSMTAVVGLPDEVWGQVVCACIVRSDSQLSRQNIINHCERNLAGYKKPRRIVFLDSLPTNALGKIVKHELVSQVSKMSSHD